MSDLVGAQMYTVRDFTGTEEDIAKTFEKLSKIGYKIVQVSGFGIDDAKVIKKRLDESGLKCVITHLKGDKFKDELDWVIDYHKTLDCPHTATGSMPEDYKGSGDGYKRFAMEFSEIARKLKEHDLTFSYHNHSFEFEKYDGRLGIQILIEDSDPKVFYLELDTYWVQHGGGDPAEWIRKVKGRIPVLHLKDMTVRGEQGPIMAEIGEGNLNWPEILRASKDAGVEYYLVEQDRCERDPFDSLEISLKNLKAMGL